MLRVVVTGGSGFIGSHVVERLVAAGHRVDVIDVRAGARPDVRYWPVSLDDLDGLVAATSGADVVFHLAAVADVGDAAADPVGTTDVNVGGTARVWEACRINGVKRAVLASTVWVYGSADGEGVLDEEAAFRLSEAGHLYTSSKLAAELVVQSYSTLYGQDFTILRYGIPYGPGMRDSLVVSRFVRMALAGEPITIQGDGSQHRNYVYVEDLADAHVLALRDEASGEVFNLEGGEPVTVRGLVEHIEQVLERPLAVEYLPARAGDYEGRTVSAEKAARVLGWTPQVPFQEGLRRYVEWHCARRGHAGPPTPARTRRSDGMEGIRALACLGMALAALPLLMVSVDTTIPQRLLAMLGTIVAAGTALLVSRQRARTIPAALSGVVLIAAAWLLTQATPGAISVLLGLIVGLAVGALAPAPFVFSRRGVLFTCVAIAGLIVVAKFDRDALLLPAVALALAAWFGFEGLRANERQPAHRPSWAMIAAIVALTLATVGWTGATSPTAGWFGPVLDHGPRGRSDVALTFDAASADTSDQRVLDVLNTAHVRATFFENGQTLEARPQLARAIVTDGHLIANGSWNNSGTQWLDPRSRDLQRAQAAFRQTLSVCPAYFRPPHGRHTPLMARAAHSRGMRMVTWDVSPGAMTGDSPHELARDLLARVQPGSIVALDLRGDNRLSSDTIVRALPLVLDGLRARGLRAVRLDAMFQSDGYTTC